MHSYDQFMSAFFIMKLLLSMAIMSLTYTCIQTIPVIGISFSVFMCRKINSSLFEKCTNVHSNSQVDDSKGESEQTLEQPAAALTSSQFRELCREAPIQGTASRLAPPTFLPLTEAEEPCPGLLLGLDAEFVALSLPDSRLSGCASTTVAFETALLQDSIAVLTAPSRIHVNPIRLMTFH